MLSIFLVRMDPYADVTFKRYDVANGIERREAKLILSLSAPVAAVTFYRYLMRYGMLIC